MPDDSVLLAGDADRALAEQQTVERAMMRMEAEADAWFAETPEIGIHIVSLATMTPRPFHDRAAAQIDALVRQTFVEAFYRGFNAHRDHAAALAATGPDRVRAADYPGPHTHSYVPNRKYPWFCGVCGYGEHEELKHGPYRRALPTAGGRDAG